MGRGDRQLDLFGETPEPKRLPAPEAERLEREHAEAAAIAARLPPGVRFGTSSWSFPDWAGLVYPRVATVSELAREGLRDYARHPLLTTVGIDRSYYAPIPAADLTRYADQLPSGFPCCAKAPEAVTSAVRPGPGDFAAKLERFLAALPRDFSYAVELRDHKLLTREYRDALAAHGAAHVYNYVTAMPMPGEQAKAIPVNAAPFAVIRLLLRPGTTYGERRDEIMPFNRLTDRNDDMRRQVVSLARMAVDAGIPVSVLVNNKAEGCSPLTIRALAEMLGSGA